MGAIDISYTKGPLLFKIPNVQNNTTNPLFLVLLLDDSHLKGGV